VTILKVPFDTLNKSIIRYIEANIARCYFLCHIYSYLHPVINCFSALSSTVVYVIKIIICILLTQLSNLTLLNYI